MGQRACIELDKIDIISVENKPETTKTDEILLTLKLLIFQKKKN